MLTADPCEAIPAKGPLPTHFSPGSVFSGRVTYVGDGDSLCVAQGVGRHDWIEVRLADFYAPELNGLRGEEAKQALSQLALGKPVICEAQHRSYDRIVARCTINGVPLGDTLRARGVPEGGRGRR